MGNNNSYLFFVSSGVDDAKRLAKKVVNRSESGDMAYDVVVHITFIAKKLQFNTREACYRRQCG